MADARKMIGRRLREIMSPAEVEEVEHKIREVYKNRKGYLGNLVEKYVFDQKPNSRPEADFVLAGVELKTTPLKKLKRNEYVFKERLVFSKIDYMSVINEKWDQCSFMEKNRLIILMLYLYEIGLSLLDYEFKYVYELDLLRGISEQDALQIRKDWEHIVERVKNGEAHLLSEAETYYLGACTKGTNGEKTTSQPFSDIPAKPRAFALKQRYLNSLIKGEDGTTQSLFSRADRPKTIDDIVSEKLTKFIGMTDEKILGSLGNPRINRRAKHYARLLANVMLVGETSMRIEELEKANVTIRAITLESSGKVKESSPFSHFGYNEISKQTWEESELYETLEKDRFLFVIFRKSKGSNSITFEGFKFWNFPVPDIAEAEETWKRAVDCIKNGNYECLPKISEGRVIHVRPHGTNGKDKIETPQGTQEMKKSFWLNAKYVQSILEG